MPHLARVIFAFLVLAWSCGKSPTGPSSTSTVADFVSGAVALGATQVAAVTRPGTPPAPAGGPTAVPTSATTAGSGGGGVVLIQGSAPFQTVFVSIGPVTTSAKVDSPRVPHDWMVIPADLFEVGLSAATVQPTDFLQIDLAAPVMSVSVAVSYATSLPAGGFDLQVQLAGASGAAGPIASLHKTVAPRTIGMVGTVFAALIINPNNPTGPGLYVNPVYGATVSTSLDSRTAVTDANGAFHLQTDTPTSVGRCFVLTITAASLPTYSTGGWFGNQSTAQGTAGVRFTLSPPFPAAPGTCS